MKSVSLTRRTNPLTRLVQTPGGLPLTEAVRAAKRNIASVEGECVAEVDRLFGLLARSAAQASVTPGDVAAQEEVYAQANLIAGLAGACGLGEVGEAAFSLCELTDIYILGQTWNAEAVSVHLNAMAVLRDSKTSGRPEIRRAVLDGLVLLANQAKTLVGH